MAEEKVILNKSTIVGIGNAIREKEGTTDLIPTGEMEERIRAIETKVNIIGEPEHFDYYFQWGEINVHLKTYKNTDDYYKTAVYLDNELVLTMTPFVDDGYGGGTPTKLKPSGMKYFSLLYQDDGYGTIFLNISTDYAFEDTTAISSWVDDYIYPNMISATLLEKVSSKNPIKIDNISFQFIEQANIKLEGEYDGSTLEVSENCTIDIKSLIENEKKIPLAIKVNAKPQYSFVANNTLCVSGEVVDGKATFNTGQVIDGKLYL